MNLEISPLILFLLILLLLALSVYFGKLLQIKDTGLESFINYNYSTPLQTTAVVSDYSPNPIIKLYDNVYFDSSNGNIVKLISAAYGSGNLNAINVCARDGQGCTTPQTLPLSAPLSQSNIPTMSSSYSNFVIGSNLYNKNGINTELSSASYGSNTNYTYFSRNIVFYVSWKTDTYLHVIDTMVNGQSPYSALSCYIPAYGTPTTRYYDANAASPGSLGKSSSIVLNDIGNMYNSPTDGNLVKIEFYDPSKNLCQICPNVFFDSQNGSLVVAQLVNPGVYIYPRPLGTTYVDPTPIQMMNGQTASNTSTSIPTTSPAYYPWYTITPDNNYLVMYVGLGQNTLIYVVGVQNGSYSIIKTYRFLANGNIDNNGTISIPAIASGSGGQNGSGGWGQSPPPSDNPMSDYYQWLAFWNTVANVTDPQSLQYASNMAPKSSLVPPVCPTCPNCNKCTGGGVCGSCGGQGGSGTNFGNGSSQGSGWNNQPQGPSFGQIVQDTGSGTKQLLEETGSGTKQLLEETGSGAVGLAKDTVGGAVGLAKDTVGGAVGLAKDTVGGAVGLAKEAGSGIAGLLKTNPTQVSDINKSQGQDDDKDQLKDRSLQAGTGTRKPLPGIDPYSYYGALPPKGSNYLPITADFSAFGK